MFDTGSQRTYISIDLKNHLNLLVLQREWILIKVFGIENTCVKNVDFVPLKITSRINTIVTEAIFTPTICSNVLNEDVKNSFFKLRTFKVIRISRFFSRNYEMYRSFDGCRLLLFLYYWGS